MNKFIMLTGWVLSPSRMIFDFAKQRSLDRGSFHRSWSGRFIIFEIMLSLMLVVVTILITKLNEIIWISLPLLFLAWSRINELAFAFYKDALSRLEQEQAASDLKQVERAKMALRSYIGLIIYFSLIYYFGVNLVECGFNPGFNNFFDSIYFSVVTITTLGYGDVLAIHWLMRSFVIYEVLVGLLLLVVVIGTYIGGPNKPIQPTPKNGAADG